MVATHDANNRYGGKRNRVSGKQESCPQRSHSQNSMVATHDANNRYGGRRSGAKHTFCATEAITSCRSGAKEVHIL
jgi:hypothetical protein